VDRLLHLCLRGVDRRGELRLRCLQIALQLSARRNYGGALIGAQARIVGKPVAELRHTERGRMPVARRIPLAIAAGCGNGDQHRHRNCAECQGTQSRRG